MRHAFDFVTFRADLYCTDAANPVSAQIATTFLHGTLAHKPRVIVDRIVQTVLQFADPSPLGGDLRVKARFCVSTSLSAVFASATSLWRWRSTCVRGNNAFSRSNKTRSRCCRYAPCQKLLGKTSYTKSDDHSRRQFMHRALSCTESRYVETHDRHAVYAQCPQRTSLCADLFIAKQHTRHDGVLSGRGAGGRGAGGRGAPPSSTMTVPAASAALRR